MGNSRALYDRLFDTGHTETAFYNAQLLGFEDYFSDDYGDPLGFNELLPDDGLRRLGLHGFAGDRIVDCNQPLRRSTEYC